MDKFFKCLSMVIAVFTIVFSSCSKEQSFMDIEDIPGKAKIVGTLCYDAGQGFANGVYTQLIKPVANTKVFAKVSNQSLSPNGAAKGYTYYEVLTDENGNYEVEVPAVDAGTNVIIMADSFMGTYSIVESVNNNAPIFNNKNVQYTFTEKTLSLTPYEVVICDGIYTNKEREVIEPAKYNSAFVVKVGEGIYIKTTDENDNEVISKVHNLVSGKNVVVNINGVYYGATTDSKGEAKFVIPSKKKQWSTSATIEVEGYVTNNYAYYERSYDYEENSYKYTKQVIKGTFQQLDKEANIYFSGISGAQVVVNIRMIFTPFVDEETYGYSQSDWTNFSWNIASN